MLENNILRFRLKKKLATNAPTMLTWHQSKNIRLKSAHRYVLVRTCQAPWIFKSPAFFSEWIRKCTIFGFCNKFYILYFQLLLLRDTFRFELDDVTIKSGRKDYYQILDRHKIVNSNYLLKCFKFRKNCGLWARCRISSWYLVIFRRKSLPPTSVLPTYYTIHTDFMQLFSRRYYYVGSYIHT